MAYIVTTFVYPPIPDRRWDWSAVTEDYEPGAPHGDGPTKWAAVADLMEELSMRLWREKDADKILGGMAAVCNAMTEALAAKNSTNSAASNARAVAAANALMEHEDDIEALFNFATRQLLTKTGV